MQKEINAKKHNDALTMLTRADYSVGKDGKVSYVPARYEIDSDGNYKSFCGARKSARESGRERVS